jgi:hypothetical protein
MENFCFHRLGCCLMENFYFHRLDCCLMEEIFFFFFVDLTKSYRMSRRLSRVMCLFGVIPLADSIDFLLSSFCRHG